MNNNWTRVRRHRWIRSEPLPDIRLKTNFTTVYELKCFMPALALWLSKTLSQNLKPNLTWHKIMIVMNDHNIIICCFDARVLKGE